MPLAIHIVIALVGIVATTYAVVRPSEQAVRTSYALLGLTILSGTALVVITPAAMTQACVSGLTYTVCASLAIKVAQQRLARA